MNRKDGKGRVPHQDVTHCREVNDLVHRPSVAIAVVLQCGQEIVKFLSDIPDLTLSYYYLNSKRNNKLSGRKFALFDDVISAEKGDLGAKM